MKILLARQNENYSWTQIASNLQQNPSSEDARKMVQRYLDLGYELRWCTLDDVSINNDDAGNLVWNKIEDSQNNNLLGC